METYNEEKEKFEKESKSKETELKGLKEREGVFKEVLEDFLGILSSFVVDLNKNPSTASNFLNNCTPKLRDMLSNAYVKQSLDAFGGDISKISAYLEEWFITLLEEIEKDVLRVFKMKEE